MAISVATAQADAREYTSLERRLYAALRALDVVYVPQYPVGYYTLDAYLPMHNLAVEVDGCDFHGFVECGMDSDHDRAQRAKDAARDKRLLEVHGIPTVRIWGHDMESSAQARASVRAALMAAGILACDETETKSESEPAPEPETITQEGQPERKEQGEREHELRHHYRQQALARRAAPTEHREETRQNEHRRQSTNAASRHTT